MRGVMTFEPPWYRRAKAELGQAEIPGAQHNSRILEYFAKAGRPDIGDDETAWCSAFSCYVFEMEGVPSARTLWARSWAKWGIPLRVPQIGAVCVFTRGEGGHVGLFAGYSNDGQHMLILGGNQSNKVCYDWYPVDRLIAVRWPADYRTTEDNWITETVPAQPPPPPLPPAPVPAPAPPVMDIETPEDVLDRLRRTGSRQIAAADKIRAWIKRTVAGVLGVGVAGEASDLGGNIMPVLESVKPYLHYGKQYAWIAVIVLAVVVIANIEKIVHARVDDDMSGRHMGRRDA